MANPRMTAEIGRVLGGRYRLVAPIGMGASAQVYLADDVRLRRRVAVKMLHDALAGDAEFLRRFAAEARAAAALNHPNVMAVYDWGDDEVAFIVTEYLSGGSLRSLLDRSSTLTPSQALTVGLDATRALDYAHRRGFVHRDIKPANLLFGDDGRLRIADFGLARALAEAAWTEPQGAVLGTARYASPEQAKGEKLTGKADVYSLAIVLIEAVTGEVPFAADTTLGTLMARVDRHLEVPEALGPLADVLARAGHPDPEQRIDARTLAAGLLRAAKALPRPEVLPLAGALPPAGEVAADLDPTVHAAPDRPASPSPVGLAAAGVAGSAGAVALADGADRSGLTPDDLDLDPPDWVNRADGSTIAERQGLIDPEPGRETVVVDLTGTPDDGSGSAPNGAGEADHDSSEGPDDAPEVRAGAGPAADHGAEADADADHDTEAEPESEPAELALAGVGVGAAAAAAAQPAWADAPTGEHPVDPVDKVVDPAATAIVPPVRIDDYAFPDLADGAEPAEVTPPLEPAGASTRRRRWPWVAAAVVLLGGGGGVAAAVVADRDPAPPEVTVVLPVPTFTNRSVDEARAVIEAAGWTVGDVDEVRRDGTLRGQVLAVSPEPGTRLAMGGTVDLTVSAGQEIYPVPLDALVDVTVDEAVALLADAGFEANVDGGLDHHEDVEEGRVISAVAGTGAEAERGSSIGLLISEGPRPRTVPANLVGGTEDAARQALEAERLRMAEVRSFSDDVPEGRVISTLPRAGETVPRGTVVNVEISRGPELRAIPDISSTSSIAEAVQVLRAAGFTAGEVRGPATGRPRRTTPGAGTMARPGSTVDIILG